MGLDMYAFTTSQNIPSVDFKDPKDSEQLITGENTQTSTAGWNGFIGRRAAGGF